MNLFGKDKKDTGEGSSSPVVSDKTKSSVSFLKKTVNKIGDVLHKKFGSTKTVTGEESMSNTEYLGEIYKLMVQNETDRKLDHEKENNRKKESNSEEENRHREIIKALTLKRKPKPKRVIRGPKRKEEPTKPGEPAKPPEAPKPPEVPKKVEAPKPPEVPKKVEAPKPAEVPKKVEAPKPAEVPKKVEAPKPAEVPKKVEVIKKEPAPAPTATQKPPAPPAPATTSTATKTGIATGIAVATNISLAQEIGNKISSHESAGNSEKSYNIMNNAGKKDVKWDKYNLTNMTIQQVLDLAEQRRIEFNPPDEKGRRGSIGVAMGKYQFMPSVLRGDSKNKGLAEKVFGKEWKDQPFNGDNQERLHDAFFKDEIVQLKNLKVPISEATIYMTHFVGPQGAARIYHAPNDTKMSEVMSPSQVKSNKSISELTVGEYKKRISTNKGRVIGLSFDELDQKRLNEFMQSTNIKGEAINQASMANKDMKAQDRPPVQPIQQNVVNNLNTSETTTSPTVNDRPPLSGRK